MFMLKKHELLSECTGPHFPSYHFLILISSFFSVLADLVYLIYKALS